VTRLLNLKVPLEGCKRIPNGTTQAWCIGEDIARDSCLQTVSRPANLEEKRFANKQHMLHGFNQSPVWLDISAESL